MIHANSGIRRRRFSASEARRRRGRVRNTSPAPLLASRIRAKYVYYHCTGYRRKCPDPYAREELLDAEFRSLLKGISFNEEMLTR